MKLKNILIGGLGILALTACNDFLEVDAPSKYTVENVFTSAREAERALNGVYQKMLVNDAFGQGFTYDLVLNSDVDFASSSNDVLQGNGPKRFDNTQQATSAKYWNACYAGIESANEFIYNLQHSVVFKDTESSEYTLLKKYIAEAKTIRAIFYNELLTYYGDVPFTMEPTSVTENFVPAIKNRDEIYDAIIADLKDCSEDLGLTGVDNRATTVEYISKEACWGVIARMALQAGGYSLRPGADASSFGKMELSPKSKEYNEIALEYCEKIIAAENHHLDKPYQDVFVDECNFIVNNHDDVIFELPFTKENSGSIGYRQGPSVSNSGSTNGATQHDWGQSNGGARVEAFYRYMFDEYDTRRDFVNGMWYYSNHIGKPTIRNDYTVHNNKWSKLWTSDASNFGATSESNTGINYPYLRLADVKLMKAEALLKTSEGLEKKEDILKEVREVRNRAMAPGMTSEVTEGYMSIDREALLNIILDERKLEFAGENMRWKDLVRNNKYAEVLFYTFLRYYSIADMMAGGSGYLNLLANYDRIAAGAVADAEDFYMTKMPTDLYYCWIDANKDAPTYLNENNVIKHVGEGTYDIVSSVYYNNNTLPRIYILNPYSQASRPTTMPEAYIKGIFTYKAVQADVDAKRASKLDADVSMAHPYKVIHEPGSTSTGTVAWSNVTLYQWFNSDGTFKNQILYSLIGYIQCTEDGGDIKVNDNGTFKSISPEEIKDDLSKLPVVRYILPIPREAIQRSEGAYKNQYGY